MTVATLDAGTTGHATIAALGCETGWMESLERLEARLAASMA